MDRGKRINIKTIDEAMNSNKYVYCTDCKQYKDVNTDDYSSIQCCELHMDCFEEPEDSKPFSERPCYDKMQ